MHIYAVTNIPLAYVPWPSDGSVGSAEVCPDETSRAGTTPDCRCHSDIPDHPRKQSYLVRL